MNVGIEFTNHAKETMQDREIEEDWVEHTLDAPLLRVPDPAHDGLERLYRPISDRDGRVLRVVVDTSSDPWRVITVFFDRKMRGKL